MRFPFLRPLLPVTSNRSKRAEAAVLFRKVFAVLVVIVVCITSLGVAGPLLTTGVLGPSPSSRSLRGKSPRLGAKLEEGSGNASDPATAEVRAAAADLSTVAPAFTLSPDADSHLNVAVPGLPAAVYQPVERGGSLFRREELLEIEKELPVEGSGVRGAYLTACVMIKDATLGLPEFVARNHLAGVDHFVLMDDSEPAAFEELHYMLEPVKELVTLVRVSRNDKELARSRGWSSASQINSLLECAEAVRGGTTWVAFIDADEFLEANDGFLDQPLFNLTKMPETPFMRRFLMEQEQNETKAAVCVKWRSVLTNGNLEAPPCGVTLASAFPQYCNVSGKEGHPLTRRKAIVRVSMLDIYGTPRDDSYGHIGYRFLPPNHAFACSNEPPPPEISIVHYWSMSLVDYLRKIARGRPRRSLEQRTMFDLLLREQMCEHYAFEPSSELRNRATEKEIAKLGYQCEQLPSTAVDALWTPADQRRFQRIVHNAGPAMEFIMKMLASGKHFDVDAYAAAFRFESKKYYGGFLAIIDLVPWIHFYQHGYDPETAPLWFK